MSKRFLIFGFFLLTSIAFFAQSEKVEYLPSFDKKRLHYGFYLGINKNDFKLNLKESNIPNANISVEATSGFNVGLIADLRLHKNLNLRLEPGLVSNSKRILFNHLKTSATPQNSIREIGSTYLHLPLVFKFSADRYKNIRPYVLGGVSYDYNFSSNQDNQDDNSAGQFRMKSHNFMYEVGIGVDIYLYYFKFSPSIRGVFAMNNEIKYDDDTNSKWTAPVNYMGTRGVFLTFAFE
ncbi:MAG: porin family protein [Polaribacter sp.]|uniref:type IX secretion/gliding motility protein PorT/SprT n=1 Tax=Polaribacter sp. TaxID=1920175 RepID=UPI002F35533D